MQPVDGVIRLTETGRGSSCRVDLSADQARLLHESRVVDVTGGPKSWLIKSRSVVGVARVGDLEVWITPKISISRLLFLVGYSSNPDVWREGEIGLDEAAGLVPTVAQLFARQVETAIAPGLLRGYRTEHQSSYVMRGRLNVARQVTHHHGRVVPFEVEHDDYTPNIVENRFLLATIDRLLRLPGIGVARFALEEQRSAMGSLVDPWAGSLIPRWQPTRLNNRYHSALRLAEVIWRASSPEYGPGSVQVSGFFFTMWKVFEDFITIALGERLLTATRIGHVDFQYHCKLDDEDEVNLYPDLVWWSNGKVSAVVDAKYKVEHKRDRNGLLFQILSYCVALDTKAGHLVYARSDQPSSRFTVKHAGIELHLHSVDLATSSLDDLRRQLDFLADKVSGNQR
ncbi:restriction endonuclease [Amycolatopsis sp. NPDC051102]|uniref:McrC family protein n=1 Tax=Amycolatopsis sp. NPDC051102 TaxID=3155163 RepID=UPI00341EC121